MAFIHMLSDLGMNYTLNRPLLDGTSQARIKEIGAVAPQIKDYESWHAVWLGLAKRSMEIAQAYVADREGFGMRLADRESVQIKLGEVAHQIQIGRLLVMHAAWKLDQGDRARKEVSMAKLHVADTLHQAADVAIQLNGARGYSKDTILEWIYRYARQARLVDGASEVHNMVLARFMREEGSDFWRWSAGNRV